MTTLRNQLCSGYFATRSLRGLHRKLNIDRDTFNFYLSQVRIRVELAFGRLVNKFRILNGKVEGPMERVALPFYKHDRPPFPDFSDMSLDEEMNDLDFSPHPRSSPLGHMAYLPTVPTETFEIIYRVSHAHKGWNCRSDSGILLQIQKANTQHSPPPKDAGLSIYFTHWCGGA
ncbi:hypothetical protein ACHAXR_011097 [Thalassiosira sp. AJA248-18]